MQTGNRLFRFEFSTGNRRMLFGAILSGALAAVVAPIGVAQALDALGVINDINGRLQQSSGNVQPPVEASVTTSPPQVVPAAVMPVVAAEPAIVASAGIHVAPIAPSVAPSPTTPANTNTSPANIQIAVVRQAFASPVEECWWTDSEAENLFEPLAGG